MTKYEMNVGKTSGFFGSTTRNIRGAMSQEVQVSVRVAYLRPGATPDAGYAHGDRPVLTCASDTHAAETGRVCLL